MNIYQIQTMAQRLEGNTYPGRGIVIGKTADGKKSVVAYFIMGRSANSRNRIFTEELTNAYPNAIINVHPALIPSFCGKGFYGLHVHEAALSYGVKLSGATVHFVSEECDGGPIIAQKAVAIEEGDTPETLQKRIMEEAEWKLLPQAVSLFCQGRLTVEGRRVIIK